MQPGTKLSLSRSSRSAAASGNVTRKDEPLEEFTLDTYLPYLLNVVGTKLSVLSALSYRERFGIGVPEWRVLATIAWNHDISVNALSARTSLDKVAASRAASRLVKLGFVKSVTNREDGRLVMLTTTAAGRRVYNAITPQALVLEDAVRSAIGSAAHDRLRELILVLRDALAKGVVEDAIDTGRSKFAPPKSTKERRIS